MHHHKTTLWTESLASFNERIASSSPTPGGGAVTVVAAVMGASLILMAIDVSLKKQEIPALIQLRKQIKQQSDTLVAYADRDVEVFEHYMKGLQLPKATEGEKQYRKEYLRQATLNATDIPMAAAREISKILKLSLPSLPLIKKSVMSDIGAGVYLIHAALKGVLLNVDINLAYMKDNILVGTFKDEQRRVLTEAETLAGEILGRVSEMLGA